MCSADLENGLAAAPVRRQFRTSRLDYLGNAAFQPEVAVSFAALRQLAK